MTSPLETMGDIRETKAERDPIVNVDVNGDLILDVGGAEEMQCFKVCSRTLSRAPKVFKTMLRGQSPKSSTGKKRAVSLLELPEDDPRILATLLYIIHAKFGKVPDKVTRNDLFHITILTRKYAMTEVLRPWVRQWTKPFASAFRPLGEKGAPG
ncbi:hypothetical protein SLS53_007783 [Cytospora paraplurivora]|uniref:BTB domain-containing protein n=1 Tax=Cytospora paraplurivora TaxID=2898453 RepID=A0AAN9U770_9PEZI